MTKKISKVMFVFILCVSLIVIAGSGVAMAKYIKAMKTKHNQASSAEFFFTSNLLKETTAEYDQETSDINNAVITFTLNNYENEYNYSDCDIAYTVKYWLASKASNVLTINGTITKKANTYNSNTITINVRDLNSGMTNDVVHVEVTSTSPYQKTLSAKFSINKINSVSSMNVKDQANSITATITLSIKSNNGSVVITAPAGYIPDPTNYSDAENFVIDTTNRTITFTTQNNASYTFTFLKTNPSSKVTSGFSCTLNGNGVTVYYE